MHLYQRMCAQWLWPQSVQDIPHVTWWGIWGGWDKHLDRCGVDWYEWPANEVMLPGWHVNTRGLRSPQFVLLYD